jgi:N-acetyl-anhydromuramyl-L-alanine amidase AmpD
MLQIDVSGMVLDPRIKAARCPTIERGPLAKIQGIIVHQTGGPTAASSLDSYAKASSTGAHFLVDRDGTTYQTASLLKQTWHVGKLKARCLVENRCSPAELQSLRHFSPSLENKRERAKSVPARFPSNQDSIGIELVGATVSTAAGAAQATQVYEPVTAQQNAVLKWLIAELASTLGVAMTEVFRHPDVSRKNPTEASTAKW